MDDPKWLRLVTIGLILASLAVGYFLISGFGKQKTQASPQSTVLGEIAVAPSPIPTQSPLSAYDRVVDRTKGSIQTLPKTGVSLFLVTVLSSSAIIIGLGLRKFPD